MFHTKLTIKARLIVLLGFLSATLAMIGGLGIYGMSQNNDGLLNVYEHRTVPTGQIADIRTLLMRSRMLALDAVNEPTSDIISRNAQQIDDNARRINTLWNSYLDNELDAEERALAEEFESARHAFVQRGLMTAMDDLEAGRLEEGIDTAYDVMEPAFEPLLARVDELITLQLDEARRQYEEATNVYGLIRGITIAAIVLGILLAGVVGALIIRAIVVPLNEAVRVANAIADGDLTQDIEVDRKDETGMLLTAMRRMRENLQKLVKEVTESSLTVASEANQIAAGNVSLSQRTEEQASSLQETASSMEEMTSTVRQSAENAGHANRLASEARESAEKGGTVVSDAVSAMSEINHSSKQVADIIGVIDEIAFQTNLLALNAAVEAARAGEQGRGFAVVASEVRNLAQRSASSAKEIKDLIEDSVQKVNQGTELVENSGVTLDEIIERVNKVTEIVAEIAAASEEQSAGIEQVNKAVMQLDELTQQNASMVEEATASSQSSADLANSLHELVSRYRVSDDAAGAAAPKAAASRGETGGLPPGLTAERRGPNRPWSNPPAPSSAAPRPAPRAATGTDDEWEEF
ncbi:MAG: methyl-accepting chemotaxis protein [Pseudomonadota bacterium]